MHKCYYYCESDELSLTRVRNVAPHHKHCGWNGLIAPRKMRVSAIANHC